MHKHLTQKSVYVRRAQINGENVATATHSHTVQLIRSSGDAICLKIITPPRRGLARPRQSDRVAGSWQPELRLSTASNNGPSSRNRVQRKVNKTSSRTDGNALPLPTAAGHLPSRQQLPPRLPTARSMPDLTAAADKHSAPDHAHRHQNNNNRTGQANDGVQVSSDVDHRDRVLYELTNQLRPTLGVIQPPLALTSSTQRTDNDRTVSENRPHTKSADLSTTAEKRPVPPPRGMSLSSRLHASTPVVSLLTASRAKSTGNEFKELLAVSGHAGTSSRAAGHEEHSFTNSPSAATRSIISGEHLVLPSQLKKSQRLHTDDGTSKQGKVEDTETSTASSHDGVKLNGHSSIGTRQTVVEQRSPVPKRPAPPPPSTKLAALPATNGEVNFLVMAEQARRQYILSKMARDTLVAKNAAEKSSAPAVYDHHTEDATQANDHGVQTAVNSSATTNGESHFMANGKNLEHQRTSNDMCIPSTSPPKADVRGWSHDVRTVQQTDSSSLSVELLLPRSALQLGDSTETSSAPPPAIPPKRRPRNNTRVELHYNEIPNVERQQTPNGKENETQLQASTNEFSGDKLPERSAEHITQDTLHQDNSNEHGRRSNAKLIRGKNVIIRRSGASRLLADDTLATSNKHSLTNGHKSCEDAEQIQQLVSMCDVGVLPPPPDFAD